MPYYRAPAPDAVLDAILHRAVKPENAAHPLAVCIRLGLGRDPTVDEVRRMMVRAEAGRQAGQDRLTLAEAKLAVAEERDAAGLEPLDWAELERTARSRLGRSLENR